MRRALALAFVLLPLAALAQPDSIQVGEIAFFGTAGVDVARVRAQLPVHEGDTIRQSDFETLLSHLKSSLDPTLGNPPTDVALVCCDDQQRLLLYIGLGGSNSSPLTLLPAPHGSQCLPQPAVDLYQRAMDANMKAVEQGDAAEDETRGYPLAHNPGLRQQQLAMRDYALHHLPAVQAALRNCAAAENRRTAAEILGFADRSAPQVAALVRAAADSDSLVRNNAVRALGVLASADHPGSLDIPARALIQLLNSDKWTDRNKGGFLFLRLTKSRDPRLLADLRRQAFVSLVEMARWREAGHASLYRVILGRMAGMNEAQLEKLAQDGPVEAIIAAAEKSAPHR